MKLYTYNTYIHEDGFYNVETSSGEYYAFVRVTPSRHTPEILTKNKWRYVTDMNMNILDSDSFFSAYDIFISPMFVSYKESLDSLASIINHPTNQTLKLCSQLCIIDIKNTCTYGFNPNSNIGKAVDRLLTLKNFNVIKDSHLEILTELFPDEMKNRRGEIKSKSFGFLESYDIFEANSYESYVILVGIEESNEHTFFAHWYKMGEALYESNVYMYPEKFHHKQKAANQLRKLQEYFPADDMPTVGTITWIVLDLQTMTSVTIGGLNHVGKTTQTNKMIELMDPSNPENNLEILQKILPEKFHQTRGTRSSKIFGF